jgi:O-antigen/teichoic acid export membrane protein
LRRTTACTLLLAVLAVLAVAWGRTWLSDLVFGSASHREMMLLLAIGLGVVIVYNFLISLYTALRQVKLVSAIQFAGSVLFALVGVGLLLAWRTGPESVVIAFLAACLLASAVPLLWWGSIRPRPSPAAASLPNRSLWAKVLPFALSLWVTNWLSNLFSLADRFMIVHYGGLPPADALNMVGQYHTARIFPVLFVGVAELLAAVITPHLSSDWEAGRSARVSQRLGLILKGSGVGLVAASTLVLVVAPVLFNVVWQERYGDGLLVLPWALVCSVWTGLAVISCNYVWCAEKSRYVSLTLLAGLALNVAMNLFLLPCLGLLGAVLAAAAARLAALGLLWWFAWRLGMRVDRGLVIVAALPLLLCLGPWAAMIALVAVLLGLVPGAHCFNRWEKDRLADMARQAWLSLPRRTNERV